VEIAGEGRTPGWVGMALLRGLGKMMFGNSRGLYIRRWRWSRKGKGVLFVWRIGKQSEYRGLFFLYIFLIGGQKEREKNGMFGLDLVPYGMSLHRVV